MSETQPYIVSARKYRPVRFAGVVGQEHVTRTLQNAIKNNQLGQAFLFCGPRGVGKTTCARILARVLNCESPEPGPEPCGKCDSCRSFNESASFNVHELDAASHNSVDEMRGLIEQVRFLPQKGQYKIYIIDEVHMLTQQAFNAFLKTLEEPPAHAVFILATTEKHKIIPTILSRCQIFDFNRISVSDIVAYLQKVADSEGFEYETEALHIIAQKADGALRDALSVFDKVVSFGEGKITRDVVSENLHVLDYDYYFRLTELASQGDITGLMVLLDEIIRRGFEGDLVMAGLSQHLRDLLMSRTEVTLSLLEVPETLTGRYREQATALEERQIFASLELLNQFEQTYKASNNKRLHTELALLRMGMLFRPGNDPVKKKPETPASLSLEKNWDPETASKPAVTAETRTVQEPREEIARKFDKTVVVPEGKKPETVPVTPSGPSFFGGDLIRGAAKTHEKKSSETGTAPEAASAESVKNVNDLPAPGLSGYLHAWKQCAAKMDSIGKPSLASIMRRFEPAVEEDKNRIRFPVLNDLEKILMTENISRVKNFLAESMGMTTFELEIFVDEKLRKSYDAAKPYTPQQRFEFLKKKNPAIQHLKDTLNLDLEL